MSLNNSTCMARLLPSLVRAETVFETCLANLALGGSRGIGLEVAKGLAEAGADVSVMTLVS